MTFDYNKLRGKIKEVYGTQENFSTHVDMGRTSLSQKLNNQVEFTQKEILDSCHALNIDLKEISLYFFTEVV